MSDSDEPNREESSAKDDYSSSDDNERQDNNLFPDTDESDQTSDLHLAPLKLATVTCLHRYAIARMEGAGNNSLPWPPLMLAILTYLNRDYKRRELITERNICMLELLVKVPIQLRIRRIGNGDQGIDLNHDETLDFTGMSFVESLEIVRDLLVSNIITQEHIRDSARKLL